MVPQRSVVMVMNGRFTSQSFHFNQPPIPGIGLFQIWPWYFQGQGYGCGKRARSYKQLSIYFLFVSHQSDQQFQRYRYFEIWPWKIQGQGHEWGQGTRSRSSPNIQPMHLFFVLHQSDQLLTTNSYPWFIGKVASVPLYDNHAIAQVIGKHHWNICLKPTRTKPHRNTRQKLIWWLFTFVWWKIRFFLLLSRILSQRGWENVCYRHQIVTNGCEATDIYFNLKSVHFMHHNLSYPNVVDSRY